MAQLNVNRKAEDSFYRYKMPRLICKVEGSGNGIKTLVVNMVDIGKALHVPPSYLIKYFGIELGAQVILDEKNERYIVNGSHPDSKLQNILYGFIDKYVLCPSCDNPETKMIIQSKREKIKLVCRACGNQNFINHSHRINAYIFRNPPPSESNGRSKEDDGLKENDTYQPKTERIESEWLTDTSQAAIQERMSLLSDRAAELTVNSDLERPLEDRLQMLVDFSKNILKTDPQNYSKIIHESNRLDLDEKGIVAVCEALFSTENLHALIKQYTPLLLKMANTTRSQRNLIGCVEAYFSRFPNINPKILLQAFHYLYQEDIICEDVFLSWSEKKSRHLKDPALSLKFKSAVEPFISWLKTAEEESSEDETTKIVFQESLTHPPKTIPQPVACRRKINVSTQSDDDLNIDDI